MPKTLDWSAICETPDRLNGLSIAGLRTLWAQYGPKTPSPSHRAILLRDLAFVAQSGGTKWPLQTEPLIRMAMKAASVIRSPDDRPERPRARLPSPKAVEDLPAGAMLTREWGQQTHQVTVLGGGWFQYQGQSYKSLTLVAKVITGAHWSGPRFFGLHRFREQTHG